MEETSTGAGEARVAAGRVIVPVVRTQTVAAGPGLFITAEPIGLVISGEGWAYFLTFEGAEVPDSAIEEAVKKAQEERTRPRETGLSHNNIQRNET